MAQVLRLSTAATVVIGPFVATANGLTPDTSVALGGANASAVLMKHNGVTFATITNHSWTHESRGCYTLVLNTGDTNTVGRLSLFISNPASYLPVWVDYQVMKAQTYDALYGTDNLYADVRELNATLYSPQAAPASQCIAASALAFQYSALRNKTVTSSSLLSIRNYADNATVATSALSDDGTIFTRNEFI
jgi:hypothetical protein